MLAFSSLVEQKLKIFTLTLADAEDDAFEEVAMEARLLGGDKMWWRWWRAMKVEMKTEAEEKIL